VTKIVKTCSLNRYKMDYSRQANWVISFRVYREPAKFRGAGHFEEAKL
jgi:hypothetical protein